MDETNQRMHQLLAEEGARVDGVYICPHFPPQEKETPCACHKPKTGLAQAALADLQIDPERIYVVGDRETDLQLAANLGGVGVLVKTGYGSGEWAYRRDQLQAQPAFVAENISEAVRWIIIQEMKLGNDILPSPQYQWPDIDEEIERKVVRQLYSTISIGGNGESIGELEQVWAHLSGRRYAISFASGTMALYAAFRALGIGKGDEVILPAYGFFASASPLLSLGAVPVFGEVDETGNLDPAQVEGLIGEKTRAILISHIFGAPADMQRMAALADRFGLALVEDASHAVGAERDGIRVGSVGRVAMFSLQAKKLCPAGEGGILVCDDEDLYIRATMHGHFKQKNLRALPAGHPLTPYHETGAGLKLRLHPLAAAIGISTAAKLPEVQKQRRLCAGLMMDIFKDCPELSLLGKLGELSLYNLPLLLRPTLASRRDEILQILVKKGYTHFFRDNLVGVIPSYKIFSNPQVFHPEHPGCKTGAEPPERRWKNAFEIDRRIFLLPLWHQALDFPIAESYARALVQTISSLSPLPSRP